MRVYTVLSFAFRTTEAFMHKINESSQFFSDSIRLNCDGCYQIAQTFVLSSKTARETKGDTTCFLLTWMQVVHPHKVQKKPHPSALYRSMRAGWLCGISIWFLKVNVMFPFSLTVIIANYNAWPGCIIGSIITRTQALDIIEWTNHAKCGRDKRYADYTKCSDTYTDLRVK